MDGALGRFTTMDPMAEKYYSISPYAYCANNPMRFVDPTGMEPEKDERVKEKKDTASFWTKLKMFFDDKFSVNVDTRPHEQQRSVSDKKMAQGEYDNSTVDAVLNGPQAVGLSVNVSGQMPVGGVDASIGVVYITEGTDKGFHLIGEGGVPVLSTGFSASVSGNVSFTYRDNTSVKFKKDQIEGPRNEVNIQAPFTPISVGGFKSITKENEPGTFGFSVGSGVSTKKVSPTLPASYKVVNSTIFR